MKSWYKSLLEIVNAYYDFCVNIENERKVLDEQMRNGIIGGKVRLEKNQELDARLQAYQVKQREAVERIRKNAYKHIQSRYGLHGASMTSDAQMFINDQIRFSENEIRRYVDQYKDNPTMLRIISEYCGRHNMTTVEISGIMSAEGIRTQWDDNCNVAVNCMNNGSALYVSLAMHALENAADAAMETIEED